MGYIRANIPTLVFHLTKRANLKSILNDKTIKRMGDSECWFCESLENMKKYMSYTVMCEGKPYIDVGGIVRKYPKYNPNEYCILKIKPRYRIGNWVRWMQEMPRNAPEELLNEAKEFSMLKIGFRGDLKFEEFSVLNAEGLPLNDFGRRHTLAEEMRKLYPPGTRIKLKHMEDFQAVEDGMLGTLVHIDDQAFFHMRWDNGRTLALDPEEDSYEIISTEEETEDYEEQENNIMLL